MIEAAVPCHKSQAVFRIPEDNYLGSFAPVSESAAVPSREAILKDFKVIMYAPECPQDMLQAMKLDTAASPAEALEKAFAHCGKNAKVAVIPEGVSVIPVKK